MMMAGTTRNVATSHAVPMRLITKRPSQPARSRSAWRTRPTVAVSSAQGTRPGIRANARRIADPTVGSWPVKRSWAPETSAPLKNTLTMLTARTAMIPITIIAGSALSSPEPTTAPPLPVVVSVVSAMAIATKSSGTSTAAETRNDSTGSTSSSRS